MEDNIINILKDKYKEIEKLDVKVEGTDCGGYGVHILIITDDFKGKKLLDRQREIQNIINFKEVHKITMKTLTKEEGIKKGFIN